MKQPKIDIDSPAAAVFVPWAKRQLARFKKLLPFGKRQFNLPSGEKVSIQWGMLDKIRVTAVRDTSWAFYLRLSDFHLGFALLKDDGSVVGPRRGKIGVLSGSSFAVGFKATGLVGTEVQHDGEMQVGITSGRASSLEGASVYVPVLNGVPPAINVGSYECEVLAQYKADDGSYRLLFRYVTDLNDPMTMRYAMIKYHDGVWSEVNGPAWAPSAYGASTGLSVVNTGLPKPPRQYKYEYPTPLGGSVTFDSNFEWFGYYNDPSSAGIIGQQLGIDLNAVPINAVRMSRTFITSVTPDTVVTDYDDATHSIPLAQGCWLDVQGTYETWLSRIDPDTLVHTELEHFTRTFTMKFFIASIGGGAPFIALNGGRIKDMVPGNYTPLVFDGQAISGRPIGYGAVAPFALAASTSVLTPTGFIVFDTWIDLVSGSFNPSSGPTYTDIGGSTQHAGNYSEGVPSPNVDIRVDGVSVYTDSLAGAGTPPVANSQGFVSVSAAGKFIGFYLMQNSGGEKNRNVFWDGASMSTVDRGTLLTFPGILYRDGSRYVLSDSSGVGTVYVNGVAVVTIPAALDGRSLAMFDYKDPEKFYGFEAIGLGLAGFDYTVKQVDGVWTVTAEPMPTISDTWENNGDSFIKAGDIRSPNSSLMTPRLAVLNSTMPAGMP